MVQVVQAVLQVHMVPGVMVVLPVRRPAAAAAARTAEVTEKTVLQQYRAVAGITYSGLVWVQVLRQRLAMRHHRAQVAGELSMVVLAVAAAL